MRRLLSLVLLGAALLSQAPVACLATGHGTIASAATHDGAHAHHGHGADSESKLLLDEEASLPDGSGAPACAAVARCHWTALPQQASATIHLNGGILDALDGAAIRPVEPITRFPTPPPRQLS